MRETSGVRCVLLGLVLAHWTAFAADKNGVSPTAISLPKGPGSIEGLGESFQPTLNTGTSKYGMALVLPPGTAGHQPALRLSYEGGSGNGVLGYGWRLPQPMIQRRSDQGIPLYGEDLGLERTDHFIDEMKEELVPFPDGVYFSEHEEAFVRYHFLGDHWEGTRPDGTQLRFGLTENARIQDSDTGRVFAWLLEEETDLHGNTIVYTYRSFDGEQNRNQKFLSTVSYGPGAPPWDHFHFAAFEYEDRPDWFEDCRPGFVVRSGRRLKAIAIGTQGVELPGHLVGDWNGDGQPDVLNRRYEFSYLNYAGADSHWSLLAGVQTVGADGASRLPPTSFGYAFCNPPDQLSAAGAVLGGLDEPPAVMDNALVELADLNGDGLPDILQTFAGDLPHRAFLNHGVDAASRSVMWLAPRELSGDGRAWNVNLASTLGVAHLADMNGDGLADLVTKTATGDVFYFANSGGLKWDDRQSMSIADVAPPSPFGQPGVRSADLDFDKRMDIIQSLDLGGGIAYRIWFNLGNQRYAPSLTVESADVFDLADPTVQIADFNGDRVPDLVRLQPQRLLVKAGLGYGRFTEPTIVELPDTTLSPEQIRQAKLTDVTGDGMADLVLERAAPGELWYWINLGNDQLSPRKRITDMPLVSGTGAVVRWADMNGNGTTDLVYADGASLPRLQTVDIGELINCGAIPNILTSIANGLGRTTQIEYRSSIEFRLADEAAGSPWPNVVPISVPVVASVTLDDSLGHAYRTEYRYHDGYYDPEEKQFRGFARVEQFEVGDATAPTLVTRHHFDTGAQVEAMKGKLLQQSAEEEDGRVYWDETLAWTVPPQTLGTGTNGQTVQFVHPIGRSRVVKELGQGTERQTESEMDYDNYGNQTLEANYGVVEDGDRSAFHDERITATDYALNLEQWIVRLPQRRETRDLEGKVISRTEYFYDDETFTGNNPGQVSLGNLTLQREWTDPANPAAFLPAARSQYDEYGNANVVLDPLAVAPNGVVDVSQGHVRTITRDPQFHAYADSETVHLGAGKAPLVFRALHDQGFGTVLTAIDFNTHVTTHTYDAFARLTAIAKPGDAPDYPTSEYRYGLAVPVGAHGLINYVETRLLDQPPDSRPTRLDHYMISRDFTDGLGRKLMTKREAEPQEENRAAVVVSSATIFNSRRTSMAVLNPFFSNSGVTLDDLLAYEEIEEPGWTGRFHEAGALVNLALSEAHKTTTWYDATLREIRSINPDATFETTGYEPLVMRLYDANQSDPGSPHFGASMAHFEDGLGRLMRVDEIVRLNDDGSLADAPATWTTRYAYDPNDQLTRITDSQDNVKEMTYDGLNRKTEMNDPDRGLMRYAYDDAGNLIETTDAKDQRITFTYDGANRILSKDYHDTNPRFAEFEPARPITPTNRPDVAYFYDTPETHLDVGDGTTMTTHNTVGFLATIWDLTGEEHFDYDERETTTAVVKRVLDPRHGRLVSYRTGYRSDPLNRVTRVTYPDDDFIEYEYNERGLGQSISGGPTGSIISGMRYSPAGQLTRIDYGNGVQTTSAYDANLRLKEIRTRQPQLGLEHIAFSYTFDPASNVKSIADLRSSAQIPDSSPLRNSQSIDYDDLYRMIRFRYSTGIPDAPFRDDGEIQYRYDRIGNMLAQSSNIPQFDQGFSVTDLGTMAFGGLAGRTGRTGRAPTDPPGPHALTQIQTPNLETREYPYDANGNMLNIDGLAATWDFDDRLTSLENANVRADYAYDHRDGRIIKKVTAKSATDGNAGQIDSVIYVNQYFEIRPNNVAIKYVWCGNTRVARVTTTLSTNLRLQRIRLWNGWNLCALGLTAEDALAQFAATPDVTALFRWDAAEQRFKPIDPTETLPAGTVLWIHSLADTTIVVRGQYDDNASPSIAPAGGLFHPGAPPESLDLQRFVSDDADLWRFDAANQRWQARLSDTIAGLDELPSALAPGEGLFVHADHEVSLSLPDPAVSIRYYHQDHLGSSAVMTDRNGVAIEETSFYPFGLPRHNERTIQNSDPYQFTQKERDQESGLNCLEARYQSPVLGRFLRVDPLAGAMKTSWLSEPQRLNLYAYCANSPLGNSDPSGTDLLGAFKGFGMGVAEGAWECVPKDLNPVTMTISATVGLVEVAKHKAVQFGGVVVETYNGNYKKAAILAITDERVVKMMDPTTSDEETGRIIGKETGKALVIIATAKLGAGGPKEPLPPPPEPPVPPPARVAVGPPMNPSGQVATTQPAIPKGPTTQVAQPAENLTQPGGQGHARDVAREARIAEGNKRAQGSADRMNRRMRETQDFRDWLTSEGQQELVRKYVGDILNE